MSIVSFDIVRNATLNALSLNDDGMIKFMQQELVPIPFDTHQIVSDEIKNKMMLNASKMNDLNMVIRLIQEGFDSKLFDRYLVETCDVRKVLNNPNNEQIQVDGHQLTTVDRDEKIVLFRDVKEYDWNEIADRLNISAIWLKLRYDELKSEDFVPHIIQIDDGRVVCVTNEGYKAHKYVKLFIGAKSIPFEGELKLDH